MLRVVMGLAAVVFAMVPLFSACSAGSTCLRQSDCSSAMACVAGVCTNVSATDATDGGSDEASTAVDASTGSAAVDAGTTTIVDADTAAADADVDADKDADVSDSGNESDSDAGDG